MALKTKPHYSFDDYLATERESADGKCEYLDGQVFAMTGASFRHNLIVGNLVRELGQRLRDGPCLVLPSDMRVRIEAADASKYPDVVALCEAPRFYDGREDVLLNPSLVIEVLSSSTEAYDRGGKFALYRRLPSLRDYVLVNQELSAVECFARQPDGRWLLSEYTGMDSVVFLESLECEIPVSEIYAKVELDSETAK